MKRVIGCNGTACVPRGVIQSHLFVQSRENDNLSAVDETSLPSLDIGIPLIKSIIASIVALGILMYDIGMAIAANKISVMHKSRYIDIARGRIVGCILQNFQLPP